MMLTIAGAKHLRGFDERAARRSARRDRLLIRQGGKAPAKMIRIGPPMPVPNQSAAKGTQAIGAMKRVASKIGRDDLVEQAEPSHQQAKRNADEGAEQKAVR